MSEQNKPFVVTDRRKFTLDGTPRPDADPSPEREPRDIPAAPSVVGSRNESKTTSAAAAVSESATQSASADSQQTNGGELPPPPTVIEMEQANAAYQQTAERLDTAVRASNPGMDHPPAMTFDAIVQSIFMTTLLQLGATAPEGQQPRIDLMGARQSIDMLGILADKTRGNLSDKETHLLDNALFEVRMGFLEVTQALARSAATRGPAGPGSPGAPGGGSGRPSIVR
jgi:hypothetical protein